jgi:hypothetical protein
MSWFNMLQQKVMCKKLYIILIKRNLKRGLKDE